MIGQFIREPFPSKAGHRMANTVIKFGTYRMSPQINTSADVVSGAKDLNFGLSLHLHLYFGNANSEGSGKSTQ